MLELTPYKESDLTGLNAEGDTVKCFPFLGSCGGSPCIEDIDCSSVSDAEFDSANEGVGFGEIFGIGSFSRDEKDLIIEGLAFLQSRMQELADWACCLFWGNGSTACDCLMAFVNGERDIDIRRENQEYCVEKDAWATAIAGQFGTNLDDNINFCDAFFERYLGLYTSGRSECRDAAVRATAILLLHEIAHLCSGEGHDESADRTGCDPVDSLHDTVETALYNACGGEPFDCFFP